jgi:hypothetical protein
MNVDSPSSEQGPAAGSTTDLHEDGLPETPQPWTLRPWLTAGLFGLAGLLIHLVTQGFGDVPWQMAVAAFLFFASVAAAFTVEAHRWRAPALFALVAGLVMAGLAWRATAAGDRHADEEFGFAAGVLATALALPLFQAGFARLRFRTPYARFHDHVWTDAISAGGALAFTGLSWLVLLILSELFHLLQIDWLRDLMDESWFGWTFSGLAAGAALGTIRNELRLLGTLRTIVVLVLSLLAVPVAMALILFLLAMIVSGPQVLWEATRSATPVLLMCAAGAFALANTILRQDDAEMPRARVMRGAALVLALVILPLTVFAAVSMGTRVAQHGLSPERLWGLIAIAVATAFGLAYAVAVIRGRRAAWRDRLRDANRNLAVGVCVLALFLALPILDFGALSARDQLARLESGQVEVEQFDFAALRWDFGEPGRRALRRLAESGDARIAELAAGALAQRERIYPTLDRTNRTRAELPVSIVGNDPELRRLALDHLIANPWQCSERCAVVDLGQEGSGSRRIALVVQGGYQILLLDPADPGKVREPMAEPAAPLTESSRVEVRPWTGRRIFVDGKPIGPPLD